jgi:aminoglycoside phosphotransferase (APT) family kinase protein
MASARGRGPTDNAVPSRAVLDWVARAVGVGTQVRGFTRLAGATSSAVHAVDVLTRSGALMRLVLRRYVDPAVLESEPRAVAREAAVLTAVRNLSAGVPRVVATDPDGAHGEVPALLMTRVPGRPRVRPRADLARFLERLSDPLPELHATPLPAEPSFPRFHPYSGAAMGEPPAWSRHPGAWQQALTVHSATWRSDDDVVIHRDYHPLNVLWRGTELSGVVDWAWGCRGPGPVDVAHCRLNLALGVSVDAADAFLRAWQDRAGVADYDPSWDLRDAVDALSGFDDTHAARLRLDELVARSAAAL